nr:PREDICTED: lanosterol 14-alpha demethylase [Paralichthys olivaceus]
MSMHLYQLSSKLLGDTVGKVNENLTSVVLAASVITLTLGYVSKLLLRQASSGPDLKHPPYIPSSIPFLGHAIAFGKSPIEFLEDAYEKVRRHRCIGENFAYVQIKTIWSTLLRMFEFDLVDGYFPTIDYTTMIHTPHNPVIRYKRRKP